MILNSIQELKYEEKASSFFPQNSGGIRNIDFYILLLKTKIKIIPFLEGRRELRYSRNTTKIDFPLIFYFLKTPNGIRNVDFYILLLNTRNLA